MKLLCGEQWKAFSQINSRLRAEDREGASAGAIAALLSVIENKMKKFVILTHLTNVTFVQREATEKPAEVALFFGRCEAGLQLGFAFVQSLKAKFETMHLNRKLIDVTSDFSALRFVFFELMLDVSSRDARC
jgi:hypothetical protein